MAELDLGALNRELNPVLTEDPSVAQSHVTLSEVELLAKHAPNLARLLAGGLWPTPGLRVSIDEDALRALRKLRR